MTDWHGYPQHPDAHPERPWWRKVLTTRSAPDGDGRVDEWAREEWARTDSAALQDADMLAAYDATHPLPCPDPKCGQVWVLEGGEGMVTGVLDLPDGTCEVRFGGAPAPAWPPAHAVLVAGPGSPWADTTPKEPR